MGFLILFHLIHPLNPIYVLKTSFPQSFILPFVTRNRPFVTRKWPFVTKL